MAWMGPAVILATLYFVQESLSKFGIKLHDYTAHWEDQ